MTAAFDRVALIGPRAAGKTTLAGALAGALGWPAVDTDECLAARAGSTAGVYLARHGESAFRALEEPVCLEVLAAAMPSVVALGGGAVLSPAVRGVLAEDRILVVWLWAPAEVLVERLRGSALERPPLTSMELEDEVRALLQAREPFYRALARIRINTFSANVDACVARISGMMGAAS